MRTVKSFCGCHHQLMQLDKKAVFINTASQIFVRFVTLIFTLISIKLLTNYLGPGGVGEYNTITTYINFFIVIADLGLFSVSVREIAKNPEKERSILSNVLLIRLISVIIASIVASAIVFLTKYSADIKIGTLIATGFLIFNLLGSVYDSALQYRLKMQFSALAEFLSKLIAITALYLIILNHGNFLFVISTVSLSGLMIFLFKWLLSRKFVKFGPSYNRAIAKWIFGMAWPLGLVFIVNNLFFKLDTLMLFAIKGAAAVGIYSVSYKVLEVTAGFGAYFASALKPTFSSNIASNSAYISSIVSKSINVMLLISLPITIISVLFPREVILLLSNPEFITGSTALVMLGFTLPLIYLVTLLDEILVANDERKLLIKIAIFILLFNFILNLILIPLYSFKAAAFTTLLSETVLFGISYHYTQKILHYRIDLPTIVRIIFVAIVSLSIGFLLKMTGWNFILLTLIIFVFYAVLAWIMRIYSPRSIRDLIYQKNIIE